MAKTILVTGGTRGIGMAVVRRLARDGHRLAVSYRSDRAAAVELGAELAARGVDHALFAADLADPEQAAALPDRVAERFGGLDALVNNAGMTDDGAFLTMDPERWRRVLRTNLFGTMRTTAAALPHLRRAAEPAVVVVSSLGGVFGKEGQVAYAASKGALIGFTQWLGRACRDTRIAVNAVAPGFIETGMVAGLDPDMMKPIIAATALNRIGRPEEVADAVRFLLAPGYIQSTTLRVDGGFAR